MAAEEVVKRELKRTVKLFIWTFHNPLEITALPSGRSWRTLFRREPFRLVSATVRLIGQEGHIRVEMRRNAPFSVSSFNLWMTQFLQSEQAAPLRGKITGINMVEQKMAGGVWLIDTDPRSQCRFGFSFEAKNGEPFTETARDVCDTLFFCLGAQVGADRPPIMGKFTEVAPAFDQNAWEDLGAREWRNFLRRKWDGVPD